MSIITPILTFVAGFVLGSLGSTVRHLKDEIDRANADGHRR